MTAMIAVSVIACDNMHTLEVALEEPLMRGGMVAGTLPPGIRQCTDCGAPTVVMDTLATEVPDDFPHLDTYELRW